MTVHDKTRLIGRLLLSIAASALSGCVGAPAQLVVRQPQIVGTWVDGKCAAGRQYSEQHYFDDGRYEALEHRFSDATAQHVRGTWRLLTDAALGVTPDSGGEELRVLSAVSANSLTFMAIVADWEPWHWTYRRVPDTTHCTLWDEAPPAAAARGDAASRQG